MEEEQVEGVGLVDRDIRWRRRVVVVRHMEDKQAVDQDRPGSLRWEDRMDKTC